MQKVDEAIRQFNLMADAADEIERQYAAGGCQPRSDASAARIGKGQPAYLECGQAGRVAYKGARRAGMSREEASTASAEALAPLKEAKRQQIENFWRDWPATWTLAEVLVPGRWECQSSWRPGGLAAELVEGALDVASEGSRVVLRRGLAGVEAGEPDFCGLAGSRRGRPPALEPAGERVCVAALLDQAAGVQVRVAADEFLMPLVGAGIGGYALDVADHQPPGRGERGGHRGPDPLRRRWRGLGGVGDRLGRVAEQDLLFVSEVAEEGRSAYLGASGDVGDADGVEAALAEQVQCRASDRLLGAAALSARQRAALRLPIRHRPQPRAILPTTALEVSHTDWHCGP